ncbi:methylated-DNA--[protein]-cysteine S-methyltransferase [Rheinheimera sp.]|uniref:methylated-DNA--[protein]-cysteine S-methyltransferase n=1 Tax=Rheinheimera sp. TaxID=1869214 RepID=UPI00307D2B9E
MQQQLQLPSPLGLIEISASEQGIQSIYFVDHSDAPSQSNQPALQQCQQQLTDYFAGKRQQFDLPLAASGTAFQQRVWAALCTIGYGQTCSYGDIALQLQNPKAVRAVGAANGRNPLSIVVPCHRVIGANGSLTGYAGGLERKLWLLQHEQNHGFSLR